jgi:hypothetical protein
MITILIHMIREELIRGVRNVAGAVVKINSPAPSVPTALSSGRKNEL